MSYEVSEAARERAARARVIKQRWADRGRGNGMSHGSFFHTGFERMRMQFYIAQRILSRALRGIDHPSNARYLFDDMGLTKPYWDEVMRTCSKEGGNMGIAQVSSKQGF